MSYCADAAMRRMLTNDYRDKAERTIDVSKIEGVTNVVLATAA